SAKFSKIFCKSSICFCNFLDTLAVKKKGFLTTINFCSLNKLDSVKLAINSSKPSLSQSTVTCSKSLKRSSLAYDLTKYSLRKSSAPQIKVCGLLLFVFLNKESKVIFYPALKSN